VKLKILQGHMGNVKIKTEYSDIVERHFLCGYQRSKRFRMIKE